MTFKSSFDALAQSICDAAAQENTPLQEKIDAFKALTTYRAMQLKERKNGSDDEPEGFDAFAAQIGEHVNGGTEVRDRR